MRIERGSEFVKRSDFWGGNIRLWSRERREASADMCVPVGPMGRDSSIMNREMGGSGSRQVQIPRD